MNDIKERQRDRGSIKEKQPTPPKTLVRKAAIQATLSAKEQIKDAAWVQRSTDENQSEQRNRISPAYKAEILLGRKPKTKNQPQKEFQMSDPPADMPHPVHARPPRGNWASKADITVKAVHAPIPAAQGWQTALRQAIQNHTARKISPNYALEQQPEPNGDSPVQAHIPQEVPYAPEQAQSKQHIHPRSIKTAPAQTTKAAPEAKRAIKTAETSGKTSASKTKAVQPTNTSQRTSQAAKAAAKASEKKGGQKGLTKLADAAKETLAAAARSIAATLGISSGLAVVLLLLILLAAGLLLSPVGIFFSSETDSEMTLQQAMDQLNTEFSDRISEIENSVAHDEVQQNGQRALWKEILTIYAVKTTTGTENSMDAATMDEAHFAVLQEIFWNMNTIDYTTEVYTEEVTVEIEDSSGEVSEETQTVEKTRLVITISSKTAQQMAEEYGFNKEQLGYVTELLSEEYAEFWTMLTVPGVGSSDIVAVALSQVGNVGGEPYWRWYGYSSRVSWCACFVSWCGDQCGYVDSGVLPRFSYCDDGIDWFKSRGQWQDRDYIPSPGDIIFFDPDHNGYANHVGIVKSCDGAVVYTVEGNAGDAVKQLSYAVGNYSIMGYGVIAQT